MKFSPVIWIVIIASLSILANSQKSNEVTKKSSNKSPKVKPNCRADIYLLIESSDSVNEDDFNGPLKKFLKKFINEVDFKYYRMELIRYSKNFELVQRMTNRPNKLLDGVKRLQYRGAWNKLHKPLEYVVRRIENYMGPRYQNVIFITQDIVTNKAKAFKQIAKLKKYRARILGISVGDDAIDQIKKMVISPVKHAFQVANYRKLSTITGQLTARLCPLPRCYADIYICVDSSNSIGKKNFNKYVKQALLNLVASLNMQTARVEVVKYADEAIMVQKLTHNEERLIDSIKYMEYEGRRKKLHKCLRQVKGDLRLNENRGQVVLVINNGDATRYKKAVKANLALKKLGVYVFTIAYGDKATLKEAQTLSSNPKKDAYKVDTVKDVSKAAVALVPRMCYPPNCFTDVYLIVDSSDSVGRYNFETLLKMALRKVVKNLNMKQAAVELIRFANDVEIEQTMTQKKKNVLRAIDRMEYNGTKVETAMAFQTVGKRLKKKQGSRKQVALLITDSYAHDRKTAQAAVNDLKKRGVYILVAAVGKYASFKQAKTFASDPEYDAFRVDSYRQLNRYVNVLSSRICYPEMKSKNTPLLPPVKPEKPNKKKPGKKEKPDKNEKPSKKEKPGKKKPGKKEKPSKEEPSNKEKPGKKKPGKKEKPSKEEPSDKEKPGKKKPGKKEKPSKEKPSKEKPSKKEKPDKKKPGKKEKPSQEKPDKKEKPKKKKPSKKEKPKKKEKPEEPEKPKKKKTNPEKPLANEECKNDVYIVIDLSKKIYDDGVDLVLVKTIKKFIDYVDVKTSRVSIVTFSARATLKIKLTSDEKKLESILDQLAFVGKKSNSYAALRIVAKELKKTAKNGRKKHIIMFNGAHASDQCRTIEQVKRFKIMGVYIQAVAVGVKSSITEAKIYATSPSIDAYELWHYSSPRMVAYDLSVSICPPYCRKDIYFVVDNSLSLGREYFYGPVRQIMAHFINSLVGIGYRVSIISYAERAVLELPMTNVTEQIRKAVDHFPAANSHEKRMYKAYKMVRREVKYYQHGRQSNIVLIGDGKASQSFYTKHWAKKVHKYKGIKIWGVAVGKKSQPKSMARFTTLGRAGVLQYDGLRSIKTIANHLVNFICPIYGDEY